MMTEEQLINSIISKLSNYIKHDELSIVTDISTVESNFRRCKITK